MEDETYYFPSVFHPGYNALKADLVFRSSAPPLSTPTATDLLRMYLNLYSLKLFNPILTRFTLSHFEVLLCDEFVFVF
jgi:hypothetical protein